MNAVDDIVNFELEIIDESTGEVIEFTTSEVMRQYEAAEAAGLDFDHLGVRRRIMELKDQMAAMLGEIDHLLRAA